MIKLLAQLLILYHLEHQGVSRLDWRNLNLDSWLWQMFDGIKDLFDIGFLREESLSLALMDAVWLKHEFLEEPLAVRLTDQLLHGTLVHIEELLDM